MTRKISFLILSLAILAAGVTGFSRLRYWERSVRIFTYKDNGSFEGRPGRGGGNFEREFPGSRMREIPDSLRARFEARESRQRRDMEERNFSGTPRFRPPQEGMIGMERGTFDRGMRPGREGGRGEFSRGKKVNLSGVGWFLAVFASFTVLAIYFDRILCLLIKRRKQNCFDPGTKNCT